MKVGILTFYYNNDNFGGQLQARALVRAIDSCGEWQAEQIRYDYLRRWRKLPYGLRVIKSVQQAFQGGIKNGAAFLSSRMKAEKERKENALLVNRLVKQLGDRKAAFHRFSDETPHSATVFDNDSIKDCLNEYDCFICGGDQIWNDWSDWFIHNALDNFCLCFVPQTMQKFSYAPSVPLKEVRPVFIHRLVRNLRQLDAISVRENSSISLLEQRTGKKIITVADPVLLLNQEQWDKEMHPTNLRGRYVFGYLLGEGMDTRKAAEAFALRVGCQLVTVPHIIDVNEQDKEFGDIQDFSSGPAEFLSLIKNAEAIVTDSFHAAVFSMIYHKPFYVLERTTKVSGGSMGSRLTDFLKEYKLERRSVTYEQLSKTDKIQQIDYRETDQIWERRRRDSYNYLKENLIKKQ